MRVFAQLTKVDAETRRVYGRATQEVPDRAGEIFDYDSSKPLFEAWSSGIAEATKAAGQEVSLGNVRAMHGKVAAGKLVEIDFNDTAKAIDICAEIVDDAEWEKVIKGLYTGFSIGGKYVKKWADGALKRFTADPSEISIVDLPCVPTAQFAMVKAAGVEEQVSFQRYGVLAVSLQKSDLTVGELLELAKEYLPDEEMDALAKAGSDYLGRLQALVAEEVKETPVEKTETAPADETPAAAAETAPTGSEGDESVTIVDEKVTLKAAILERLKKSMWTVSSMADLLQTIAWMASDAEWEKEWERDGSSVPSDLRAWLAMGVELFKKMTAEETAELIASVTPPEAAVTVITLAAGDDLGKKGARNSKADQQKIQTVHDHSVSLGANCGEMDKALSVGQLEKAIASITDLAAAVTLAKGAAPEEGALIDDDTVSSLAKFALQKAEEVETLTKKVTTLEAMPAQPKGAVRVVPKTADTVDLVTKNDGPVAPDPKDPKAVMKAVHAQGGTLITAL